MGDQKEASVNMQMRNRAQGIFTWWLESSRIKDNDTAAIIVKKIFYRVGGILFMLLLSPVLIMALIVAFIIAL